MQHSPFLLGMHPEDLAAPQCFFRHPSSRRKNPSSRAAQSELFWLSTDISGHRNQLWVLLEKNCPFVNSCQHICRDICTGSLGQGWTFWPFWPNDQADTSWFPGRESKLPRVRYFGIFLDVIGLTFINWGFYWGDRCGLGGHWSSIKDDADASPFQWWSRPQSMATPSTIFNGDFGLLPIECWTGITGRLKCVRWHRGYISSSQDDIMDTSWHHGHTSTLFPIRWVSLTLFRSQDTFGSGTAFHIYHIAVTFKNGVQ